MKIAYSIPAFIRNEDIYRHSDLSMFSNVLYSAQGDEDTIFIFYNQGCLSNDELDAFLQNYDINYEIIGEGKNVGIPIARQAVFEYVWAKYPDIPYQCELHLDMILYPKWYLPITDYLDNHPEEPCMSPAILNGFGGYSLDPNNSITINGRSLNETIELLESLKKDEFIRAFTHPVIHNSNILKEVGGIDLRFLRGTQGFEDYSILISYANYVGTRYKWYPKVNGNTTVFHNLVTQRTTVEGVQENISINEEGLFQQYGAYGFKALSELLADNEYTGKIYEYRVNNFMNARFSFEIPDTN